MIGWQNEIWSAQEQIWVEIAQFSTAKLYVFTSSRQYMLCKDELLTLAAVLPIQGVMAQRWTDSGPTYQMLGRHWANVYPAWGFFSGHVVLHHSRSFVVTSAIHSWSGHADDHWSSQRAEHADPTLG